ncbi:MAG: tetratricopeptide repeat protein [Muribaculaceae bacterium]|nr:tetratricopeptide repeat protein [Muribaculaceae bacterium]
MKQLALLLILLMSLDATLMAQVQPGYVKTIGKPGKNGEALGGVTVRAKGGHNAVLSKPDGTFSMPMPGKQEGQTYALLQVQKKGYELNEKGVIGRNYTFSSSIPLHIVMVSTAQLQAEKQRIENKAYKNAENTYKAKKAKLEKQLKDNTISEELYRAAIQELQEKFEKYQSLIESLAEHYAHTDYDELSEKEAEINILIENCELEKADSLIHTLFNPLDVLKRNKEAIPQIEQVIDSAQKVIQQANEDYAAILKQQQKDAEHLYQLYTIALAQFDNEKASKYIQTRAELDTTNLQWQNDAGYFVYVYQADYKQALVYFFRGMYNALAQYGEDSEWGSTFYNNIGMVYDGMEDYQLALEWYLKAHKISKEVMGELSYPTATSYNNIGGVYYNLGNYEKAKEYSFKALNIYENLYGKDHPSLAGTYGSIGLINYKLGNYDEALEYDLLALEIDEKALGQYHPHVAISYCNIGMVFYDQRNYKEALNYQYKALDIYERVLGIEHPLTAASYNNIGMAYTELGEYKNALDNHFKALAIQKLVLDKESPSIATSYNNIGYSYERQGNYNSALEFYRKAINIFETQLGPEHPSTAMVYNNIGIVYHDLGEYNKALDYYTKAFDFFKSHFGLSHPRTQMVKESIETLKEMSSQ